MCDSVAPQLAISAAQSIGCVVGNVTAADIEAAKSPMKALDLVWQVMLSCGALCCDVTLIAALLRVAIADYESRSAASLQHSSHHQHGAAQCTSHALLSLVVTCCDGCAADGPCDAAIAS